MNSNKAISSQLSAIGLKLQEFSFKRLTLLWLAGCLALTYVAQVQFDAWKRYSPPKIQTSYNQYIEPQPLSGQTAKYASFGADEFLADVYWLELIQYYGGGDPYGKYRKLSEMFNVVTDLSPRFLEAYQTGLIILPGEGFVNEAIAFGKKGEKNLPNAWEPPYYTGLVYHIYKKDYIAAAHEFELAASKPGAPANAKYFAAIYYKQADQRQVAYQMFKTVYDESKDTFIRERTQKYLTHLEIIFFLQDGVKTFHNRYGRYPKTLDELVTKKVITAVPQSPLNITLTVDPNTGAILESKR